jgi:hypothetical protein
MINVVNKGTFKYECKARTFSFASTFCIISPSAGDQLGGGLIIPPGPPPLPTEKCPEPTPVPPFPFPFAIPHKLAVSPSFDRFGLFKCPWLLFGLLKFEVESPGWEP